jgi:ABC-type transporter Mla subunit MlaD
VPPTARQVLEQASDIIPEAQLSLNQIRMSIQRLEQVFPQFELTLKEVGELARVGREFVPELRRASGDLREIFAGAKDIGPEFKKTNEELRYFLRTASVWTENVGLMLKTNEPRIQAALDSLTRTLDETSRVFNEENRKNFSELLRNVTTASQNFGPLSKESTEFVREGRMTLQEFNKTLVDIQKATGPLAERAPRLLQNLETGSEQFTRAILDVRDMLKEITRADGSFQRFLSDPALYNNLNCTAESIARLMPSIQRVLRDIEVFADKIARHPESLGVGGAVRPSAGLKESPGSSTPRPRP